MNCITVWIRAHCSVSTRAEFKDTHIVAAGLMTNLLLGGNFYPSRITRCDSSLGPGESGMADIRAVLAEDGKQQLTVGTKFQLREGPMNVLANCEIVESRIEDEKPPF